MVYLTKSFLFLGTRSHTAFCFQVLLENQLLWLSINFLPLLFCQYTDKLYCLAWQNAFLEIDVFLCHSLFFFYFTLTLLSFNVLYCHFSLFSWSYMADIGCLAEFQNQMCRAWWISHLNLWRVLWWGKVKKREGKWENWEPIGGTPFIL